jgi:hypothetical protein
VTATDDLAPTTLAVGGERQVPVPDPIARDYLLLALRVDQHSPGLVDGYYGPADLKALVDVEQLRPPGRLAEDAAALVERLPVEVAATDRRDWLTHQLIALRTRAEILDGATLPYLEHVTRLFAWTPERRDDAIFAAAAADLAALVPGSGSLAERLEAWDDQFVVPVERLRDVVDWLVGRFRERAAISFGIPSGEDLQVRLVTDQPWSGYNWYDGGLRSRVDINTDLPVRAADLLHTVAHETFPGHHLEHAWKESALVDDAGRVESSVLLINTPECLISEGLADLGFDFAVPPAEEPDLLLELYDRAGLAIAADPATARDAAERTAAMRAPRRRLGQVRGNAALLRHADGASHEEALAYLERVGHYARSISEKRLEFIEHPLWRTYVFVYHEGEALLRRWIEAVPEADRAARFGRLLREQLSPPAIATEIEAGGVAAAPTSEPGA